jgi:hypothetical protein
MYQSIKTVIKRLKVAAFRHCKNLQKNQLTAPSFRAPKMFPRIPTNTPLCGPLPRDTLKCLRAWGTQGPGAVFLDFSEEVLIS